MHSLDQLVVPYDLHQFLPNLFMNAFLLTSTFLTLMHNTKEHVEKKIPERKLLRILPEQPISKKIK
jgi:hypothetical protein